MCASRKYLYKVAKMGDIPPETWEAMSMSERLDAYKRALCMETDKEAAESLGVTQRAVANWRADARNPSLPIRMALENACVCRKDMSMKEFMAINTIAIDPALDIFDKAFVGDNLVALNTSCYVLAVKLAACVEHLTSYVLVPTISTCYGVSPAYVMVRLTLPDSEIYADVKITYTIGDLREFIARVSIVNNDKVDQRFAYAMSDRAIEAILTNISKYITKHVRKPGEFKKRSVRNIRRVSSKGKGCRKTGQSKGAGGEDSGS